MDYLRTHWVGRQAFSWSFWVNFVLLCALINLAEPFILPSVSDRSWNSIVPAIAYLIVGHLLIYPWQVVGLMRACNRHLKQTGDPFIVTVAQLAIGVSLIMGSMTMWTSLQSIFGTPPKTKLELARLAVEARIPGYEIELVAEGFMVRVEGEIANGLTRDLGELLASEPEVRGIVLKSDGGRIFEARGVARLIGERGLATYVYDTCQSACTTAFIAGSKRHLGELGRLGFHQYRLQTIQPFVNVAKEQEKDLAFFRSQGVAPDLLARVFETPHDSMWYPTRDELLAADVIHQIVPHEAM